MKIEKISENQIKFILNQSDLIERDIRISELVTNSEKTHNLLREMMDTAMVEFDFELNGVPLMIEAMPVSAESVTIIVTKISDTAEFESKLNMIPSSLTKAKEVFEPIQISESEHILIYTFKSLNNVIAVSERLGIDFTDRSCLYKKYDVYYLILENENESLDFPCLEPVLSEYGEKHISTELSKYHIFEHGEPIVKNFAVNVLSDI